MHWRKTLNGARESQSLVVELLFILRVALNAPLPLIFRVVIDSIRGPGSPGWGASPCGCRTVRAEAHEPLQTSLCWLLLVSRSEHSCHRAAGFQRESGVSVFEAPSVFLVLHPSGTGPGHPHPRPWAGCHVILAPGLTAFRILVRSHREGCRPVCVGSHPHFSRRCWSGHARDRALPGFCGG